MVGCDRHKIREMREVGLRLVPDTSKLRMAKTTRGADCVMKVALFNWEGPSEATVSVVRVVLRVRI
jgi:hypothetical protein